MNSILTRISVLMAERDIKAPELCEKVGIPLTTFYTWKKRDRVPSTEYLTGIARFFGVSVDYLLTGSEPDYLIHLDDETMVLVESVKHLSKGEKLYLAKIAKFMGSEKGHEEV